MAEFVYYNDIACVYPISGQYNSIPRWLYYSLLFIVVTLRHHHWLVVGAAATCLTYGGGAAIHACILAFIRLYTNSQVPDGIVQLPNGLEHWISSTVFELDNDGTLAVVGAGFLIALPMALWSSQFRRPDTKAILVLWTALMFIGMVCCLFNLYCIDTTSDGPYRQSRFCYPSNNDSFPVTRGDEIISVEGDWNSTIWKHFFQDPKDFRDCIYPCFYTTAILRSQDEVTAIPFSDILPSNPRYWGFVFIKAMAYVCVPCTMLLCLGVLVLRLFDFSTSVSTLGPTKQRPKSIRYLVGLINCYGMIITPITLLAFVIWVELAIRLDIQSETYHHVGQWTPLVYFGLVVTSAFVGQFWELYRVRRAVSKFRDEKVIRSLLESLNTMANGLLPAKYRNRRRNAFAAPPAPIGRRHSL